MPCWLLLRGSGQSRTATDVHLRGYGPLGSPRARHSLVATRTGLEPVISSVTGRRGLRSSDEPSVLLREQASNLHALAGTGVTTRRVLPSSAISDWGRRDSNSRSQRYERYGDDQAPLLPGTPPWGRTTLPRVRAGYIEPRCLQRLLVLRKARDSNPQGMSAQPFSRRCPHPAGCLPRSADRAGVEPA